jgi:hypothetical protein
MNAVTYALLIDSIHRRKLPRANECGSFSDLEVCTAGRA